MPRIKKSYWFGRRRGWDIVWDDGRMGWARTKKEAKRKVEAEQKRENPGRRRKATRKTLSAPGWIKAKAVRVRKAGKRLVLDILR